MNRFFHVVFLRLVAAVALLSLVLASFPVPPVRASATITVTTTADTLSTDGKCSLREAIIAANKDQASSPQPDECAAGSGADTIFLPAGVYALTRTDNGKEDSASTGDLDITSDLTITGAGATRTRITGVNFTDRIFQIFSGKVNFSGISVEGGKASADGGAIWNAATLNINGVRIAANKAGNRGGGIYNTGSISISMSTISGNTAGTGGGLYSAGTASLKNNTISGNTAAQGGGMYIYRGTTGTNNVTVAYNTATGSVKGGGGGVYIGGGEFSFQNTILAANLDMSTTKYPDCYGALSSLGNNLVQGVNPVGCKISGVYTSVPDVKLGPLQDNGGETFTHALLSGSPAINAGNPLTCEVTDQRGFARQSTCDIGAYEFIAELPQSGPEFIVYSTADSAGECMPNTCTLRQAILAANKQANGNSPDKISFQIPGDPLIQPLSALPALSDPVTIDGTTQPGSGKVTLDGTMAPADANGLLLTGGTTRILGTEIHKFSASGIRIESSGNRIEKNKITGNLGAGIMISTGTGNTLRDNIISGNDQLGIDLGDNGINEQVLRPADQVGPNNLANAPVLIAAVPDSTSNTTLFQGRVRGAPGESYTVELFSNTVCDLSNYGQGETPLGSFPVVLDEHGNALFNFTLNQVVGTNRFISATATAPDGSTSEFSHCLVSGPRNDAWPTAWEPAPVMTDTGGVSYTSYQYLDRLGQSRWYKIPVQPGSKVIVTLTGLASNYDLTLYKDISAALNSAQNTTDLALLGAEFAPDMFSPDMFSPDMFSPDTYSPDMFSPDMFSPDMFSPDMFSPDMFSPDMFSPDMFSPDTFSPDMFSPDMFSPDMFSPDMFSPDMFSPDAFSSAQTRSLIGVSAFEGTASEGISASTWENSGDYYVRVRGRYGVYNLQTDPYLLTITVIPGECSSLSADRFPASNTQASGPGYHTIILTDTGRLPGTSQEIGTFLAQLQQLAGRAEVAGVVVDMKDDLRVQAANLQADSHPACPNGKNLVASAIKEIVREYAGANPELQYVVLAGDDSVIPFFRYPDHANLANERNYVPPVRDSTPAQAALRLGYMLGQDAYGSRVDVSSKVSVLPVPGLAVGRLVSTLPEMSAVVNAYLATTDGVVSPSSTLVTGYDFLEDSSTAIANALDFGTGGTGERLITYSSVSPQVTGDPPSASWTAGHLWSALFENRHDLIYLGGHFSAGSALAADYRTRLLASEVANSTVDMANTVVFSAGCHSGYDIVSSYAIPYVTLQPDWASAFASKGATLIAGTGYQYGDTDFIKYSERIYQEFSSRLLAGSEPVPVGKALVDAKTAYLASEPVLRGISEKSVIQATLFGLPMLRVNLPNRVTTDANAPIVTSLAGYTSAPGSLLGLQFADVTVIPSLTRVDKQLTNALDNSTITATYYTGGNGVVANPEEVVQPLEVRNVSVPNTTLRGIGFRGGSFTQESEILPLTGAATTEIRGVHTYFYSEVYYPLIPWRVNYFDFLQNGGITSLMLTPAQFRSDDAFTGTMRTYDNMQFRLFYSGYTQQSGQYPYAPLASPPTIASVHSTIEYDSAQVPVAVRFQMRVDSAPSAGVQEVWVTYLVDNGAGGTWQSIDLARPVDSSGKVLDSTVWEGTLPLQGRDPAQMRFIVQAVNGIGLVSFANNKGEYFIPGQPPEPAQPTIPTHLDLSVPASTGAYGTTITVSAVLRSGAMPLPGQRVFLSLGPQTRSGITDENGFVSVRLPLATNPDTYLVRAAFRGTDVYKPSAADAPFTVTKQDTTLVLAADPATAQYGDPVGFVVTLTEALTGKPAAEETVFFFLRDTLTNAVQYVTPVITDYAGRAYLDPVTLKPGSYRMEAYFSGFIPAPVELSLSAPHYNPSTVNGTLVISQENATLTYTGDLLASSGTPLNLSFKVSQEEDGSPALINQAQVQVKVSGYDGIVYFEQFLPVSADGSAATTLYDLPDGVYWVTAQLISQDFSSPGLSLYITVYNPFGRQINGSSSITVLPGSFPAEPEFTGRVSFGLHAAYEQDGKTPIGQTQITLHDTGMLFHSDQYFSLIFFGKYAFFTGSGTINNQGRYYFSISALDGDLYTPAQKDRIHIRIWDAATGTVIFDHEPESLPSAPPRTEINGGNISLR